MIERRQIDHAQLLQLGKMLLLLVKRQEPPLNFPVVAHISKEILPVKKLFKAS